MAAFINQPSPAEGWTHDCFPLLSLIFSKLLEEIRKRNKKMRKSSSFLLLFFFLFSFFFLFPCNGSLLSSRHTFPAEVVSARTLATLIILQTIFKFFFFFFSRLLPFSLSIFFSLFFNFFFVLSFFLLFLLKILTRSRTIDKTQKIIKTLKTFARVIAYPSRIKRYISIYIC